MTWLLLWSYIVNNSVIKFLKEMSYVDCLELTELFYYRFWQNIKINTNLNPDLSKNK